MNSNDITSSKSGSAQRYEMPRMRLSMFYLAGYLLPVGLLLMFAPQLTMKLLLTSHTYDDLGLRMGGVFLFALGMIVTSMIINQASKMYSRRCSYERSLLHRCSCSMDIMAIRPCLRSAPSLPSDGC